MPVHTNLQHAFDARADGVRGDGAALVGTFGEGVPRALVASLGGLAVDVKAPPLSDAEHDPRSTIVDAIAEPFLDPYSMRFLHRFAAGAFDRFATLIFARDDVAGLTAYQYALELRRQGYLPDQGPRLHLWNLLHTDSAPVSVFNQVELDRLVDHLTETLGTQLDDALLSDAVAKEAKRAEVLNALPAGGPEAFVALNAGRWLPPGEHIALLPDLPAGKGPKIALVGTACDIPVLHRICAAHGQVMADLQDYGRPAPQPANAADLLAQIARDPLSLRAAPPVRLTRALHRGIEGADLVVASVDANDDSFGWEMPGLKMAAQKQGARFLDLGFRPFRPDAAWQDRANTRIAEALA